MPFKLHDDISQDFLEDISISWKARGIILALLSMPGLNATLRELTSKAKDGITAVRSGLEELVEHGYGYFYRNHGESARIEKGEPIKRPGYVYVVQRWDNCYKIGQAINLDSRLGELVRKHGPISLIDVMWTEDANAVEGRLQSVFADKRIDNEWFELDLEDIGRIREKEGLGAQDG